MNEEVIARLDREISTRRLLDHPFYQRWTNGTLTSGELREYARQYYHYALAFPTFLSAMHAQTDDLATRQALLENLIEEERGADNHPELWLRFCESLGLDRAEVEDGQPNEAVQELIDCIRSLASRDLHRGLAALYAYESQVPGVAAAKIDGLARWYGIADARSIGFFRVHLDADVVHAETGRQLLARNCTSSSETAEAVDAASRTLSALYSFLDSVSAN